MLTSCTAHMCCAACPVCLLLLRHVAVIYIALCTFAFLIYAAPSSSTPLGSISKVCRQAAWLACRQHLSV